MKYINVDNLLEKLQGRPSDSTISVAALRRMILEEKQIDIVNCKECRYYKENTIVCSRYGLEDDDYCSWAERK